MRIDRAKTSCSFDDRAARKRIGLIVLATDHTTEIDFRRMVASDGIAVYTTRVAYDNPTTPENLRRLEPRLTAGAELLLPNEAVDAICFSCTSASAVIGDQAVERAIRAGKSGTPVVTPPLATTLALRALDARRISILTPYTIETSAPIADYFTAKGFDIDRFVCLGLDDDREMARIDARSLLAAASEAMTPSAEALFISCTALRAAALAAQIEGAIGRPVVTSNLATAWQCLRLCGIDEPRPAFGQLMTLPCGRAA